MLSIREHSTGREVATAEDMGGAWLAVRTIEREVATQGYRLDIFHTDTDAPAELVNGCPVIYEANGCKVIEHPNCGFMVYRTARLGIYKTLAGAQRRCARQEATR